MKKYFCPFLVAAVELTDEREKHIKSYHPDVEIFLDRIGEVLFEPDEIWQSLHDELVIKIYHFYADIHAGKYVVVVVKRNERNFVLTCYLTSKIRGGSKLLWKKG